MEDAVAAMVDATAVNSSLCTPRGVLDKDALAAALPATAAVGAVGRVAVEQCKCHWCMMLLVDGRRPKRRLKADCTASHAIRLWLAALLSRQSCRMYSCCSGVKKKLRSDTNTLVKAQDGELDKEEAEEAARGPVEIGMCEGRST